MEKTAIHSSTQLIEAAVAIASKDKPKRVVVAAAQDVDVIDAVSQANTDGYIDATLVGDENKIKKISDENKIPIDKLELIHESDVVKAAAKAAAMASSGDADAIMKGFLPTSTLLRTVLDKKYNLRGKNTLSHCAVLDIPGYHKLLNVTDGGMVVKPDQDQKYQILENAVLVGYALGLSPVKIAVSSAMGKPNELIPHSLSDMDFLIPRALEQLEDIAIQGSLPLDLATSKLVAEKHHSSGAVVGDADIFLVDSIEECNIVSKALINFADAVFAGVIVGAKVPVSLVSRTDTVINKKASLALAAVLSDYYKESGVFENGGEV